MGKYKNWFKFCIQFFTLIPGNYATVFKLQSLQMCTVRETDVKVL